MIPPHAAAPGQHYLAGIALDFTLDDHARATLTERGAEVLAYRERLGILHLQIVDPAHFQAPDFLTFLIPDESVRAYRDSEE